MNAKLTGIKQHLLENFNLELELDDAHVQSLVGKGKIGHGGRGLINIIEQEIVNPMSLFIFSKLHQIGERKLKLYIDKGDDGRSRFNLKE
jgi:ATP-dependent Clp protease ATP-binding subunit ClpA